jgi:hypothetical protein
VTGKTIKQKIRKGNRKKQVKQKKQMNTNLTANSKNEIDERRNQVD